MGAQIPFKANFASKSNLEKDPLDADQCSGTLPTTYTPLWHFTDVLLMLEKRPPSTPNPNPCCPLSSVGACRMSPWGNMHTFSPSSTRVTLGESSLPLWEYFRGVVTLASPENSLSVLEVSCGYRISAPWICLKAEPPGGLQPPQALGLLRGCASH